MERFVVGVGRSGSPARSFSFALFSLVSLITVASFLLVHLMGYGFFFFTPGGLALSTRSFPFPVLILFLVGFYTPVPLRVGLVFSAIWIFYGICFLAAWRWRRSFHDAVKSSVSAGVHDAFSNFLFAMPLLSSMCLTAALAIILSQSAVGLETGEPQLPPDAHEAFLNLAYAPLIEEFAFRLVPIGLLIVFYVFLAGRNVRTVTSVRSRLRLVVSAFAYPEAAKRMSGLPNVSEHGVWRGISPLEWVVILATSGIFGLAHVLSPVGWEVGKITSTFVQGVFFAVTYVAYGFEAPILLHWYFNYYFYFFDPKVAAAFFPAATDLLAVFETLILVLGVLGWVAFVVGGLRRLRKKRVPVEQSSIQPVSAS